MIYNTYPIVKFHKILGECHVLSVICYGHHQPQHCTYYKVHLVKIFKSQIPKTFVVKMFWSNRKKMKKKVLK